MCRVMTGNPFWRGAAGEWRKELCVAARSPADPRGQARSARPGPPGQVRQARSGRPGPPGQVRQARSGRPGACMDGTRYARMAACRHRRRTGIGIIRSSGRRMTRGQAGQADDAQAEDREEAGRRPGRSPGGRGPEGCWQMQKNWPPHRQGYNLCQGAPVSMWRSSPPGTCSPSQSHRLRHAQGAVLPRPDHPVRGTVSKTLLIVDVLGV